MNFNTLLLYITGTLGGYCCIIQLVLNLLGYGCAGFIALSSYMPIFAAILILLISINLFNKRADRSYLPLILSIMLFCGPEIIDWVNLQRGATSKTIEVVQVQLYGLKCSSCANRVRSELLLQPFVEAAQVQFTGDADHHVGEATLYLSKQDIDLAALNNSLTHKVHIGKVEHKTLFTSPSFNGTTDPNTPCVTYKVSGMTCDMCVSTINTHIIKTTGVHYVTTFPRKTTKVCGPLMSTDSTESAFALPTKFHLQREGGIQ
jgi:copper chaperone CopZ